MSCESWRKKFRSFLSARDVSFMKKFNFIRMFVLSFFFAVAVNGSALAYDSLELVNHTGRTIFYVYLVPSHYDSWGNDRLSGTWSHGASLTLKVPQYRYWSLKIKFKDGDSYWWDNGSHRIDTTSVWRATITPNNNGGYTLYYN